MNNEKSLEIARLQNNLSAIRKIAGWTIEELGNKIGVTKQTISNIENKKTSMSLTQYIAIRSVLDYEIQSNTNNTVLAQVVDILLNQHEGYTEEEKEQVENKINILAATAAGGISGAALAAASLSLLGPIGGAIGLVAGSTVWMAKILGTKKPKDK